MRNLYVKASAFAALLSVGALVAVGCTSTTETTTPQPVSDAGPSRPDSAADTGTKTPVGCDPTTPVAAAVAYKPPFAANSGFCTAADLTEMAKEEPDFQSGVSETCRTKCLTSAPTAASWAMYVGTSQANTFYNVGGCAELNKAGCGEPVHNLSACISGACGKCGDSKSADCVSAAQQEGGACAELLAATPQECIGVINGKSCDFDKFAATMCGAEASDAGADAAGPASEAEIAACKTAAGQRCDKAATCAPASDADAGDAGSSFTLDGISFTSAAACKSTLDNLCNLVQSGTDWAACGTGAAAATCTGGGITSPSSCAASAGN